MSEVKGSRTHQTQPPSVDASAPPGSHIDDAVVERFAVIAEAEAHSFITMRGIMAKRKLDRQLAQARREGWAEACRSVASMIRAHKSDGGLSARTELERMIDNRFLVGATLMKAFMFAAEGFLTLDATLRLKEPFNSMPATVTYTATLTPKGQRWLDETANPSDAASLDAAQRMTSDSEPAA